jgi:hypothetical protein
MREFRLSRQKYTLDHRSHFALFKMLFHAIKLDSDDTIAVIALLSREVFVNELHFERPLLSSLIFSSMNYLTHR